MKANAIKTGAIKGTEKTVRGIFGAAHFVAQTTADVLAHTEASILHKTSGMDKSLSVEHRRAATKQTQQKIRATIDLSKRRIQDAREDALSKLNNLQTN